MHAVSRGRSRRATVGRSACRPVVSSGRQATWGAGDSGQGAGNRSTRPSTAGTHRRATAQSELGLQAAALDVIAACIAAARQFEDGNLMATAALRVLYCVYCIEGIVLSCREPTGLKSTSPLKFKLAPLAFLLLFPSFPFFFLLSQQTVRASNCCTPQYPSA